MFIVMITFKQPLEVVENYVVAHRQFLDEGYNKNYLVASGPRNPRTGGIVVSQLEDKNTLVEFFKRDPYLVNNIADYEFIEFRPVKYHPDFAPFI